MNFPNLSFKYWVTFMVKFNSKTSFRIKLYNGNEVTRFDFKKKYKFIPISVSLLPEALKIEKLAMLMFYSESVGLMLEADQRVVSHGRTREKPAQFPGSQALLQDL